VADFYTGSTFKWLLSTFGVAYAVKGRFASELEPVFRGYANPPPSRDLQYSHANYPGMYALAATLEFMGALGWQAIEDRVSSLTGLLHRKLVAAGWNVVTPLQSRGGIIAVQDRNAPATVARLLAEGVEVEARAGNVRVSPHFYNNEQDLRRFLDVLGRNPG
jgi:selenocysteine lyase/cysteine desulfurase